MQSFHRSPFFCCALFCLLISSCSTCSRDSAMSEMQRLIDSTKATMEGEMMRIEMREARKEELRRMIDSTIAADFVQDTSSFDRAAVVHKTWKGKLDLNRNGLMARVYEESGEVALISTLPGGKKNLHNRIEVDIAGTTYAVDSNNTEPLAVPVEYNNGLLTGAKGEVLYIPEEEALKIMEAMAANPDAEITVRAYSGNGLSAKYSLTDEDKKAFIATLQLSRMIKELADLEAQGVEYDD